MRLYDSAGQLIRQSGALFESPMHLIGFSRGTVVNSELAQRLLTVFPQIGGTSTENRDFQMTTIDPHDFRSGRTFVADYRWIPKFLRT